MISVKKYKLFLLSLTVGIIFPLHLVNAADNSSCSNQTCADIKKCTLDSIGKSNLASSNKMDSKCMSAQSANSCLDLAPVSCVGSYGGLGYRPNGAGGNPKPRYHLGSDLGAAACMQNGKYTPINIYAAADGVVKYRNTAGCSGRTLVIEHNKGCQAGNKDSGKYKTVYRHVFQYRVDVGAQVKKGDVIAIEGGSNAGGIGLGACDAKGQEGWQGYSISGCGAAKDKCGTPNYDIHLHYEIADGAASASSSGITSSIAMDPKCDSLPLLCGSCPNNAHSCLNSKGGSVYRDGSNPQVASDAIVGSADGSYAGAEMNGDAASAREEEIAAESQNCEGRVQFLDANNCIFCGLFKSVYNTASEVAKLANDSLAAPCRDLVGIAFLIWLAIYILKQFMSFQGTSTGEMLKGIVYQGFRVAVVILILNNAIYAVMDLTLNPVMETGMNFVQSLNDTSVCNPDAEYMKDIKGYGEGGYQGSNVTGGLSIKLGQSIMCSLKKMEDATGIIMGHGAYSLCVGTNIEAWLGIIPHFGYVVTGIFFCLCGLILLIIFPWCLIDCILQMCIAAALIPCAIATYAFKITSRYLNIIWNFFMNAMFNFVFMAVVIYIIKSIMNDWIGLDESGPAEYTEFLEALGGGLAAWGVSAFKIAVCCYFFLTFFEEVKTMADKFARAANLGGSKGIGRMVGGMVAGGAASMAVPAAKIVGKTANTLLGKPISRAAGSAGAALDRRFGAQTRSGINRLRGKTLSLLGGQEIKDESGQTVGYRSSFNLFGRQQNRTVMKDENGNWVQTKETFKRSAVDKAFSKVYDQNGQEMKDANGNTVYQANQSFGANIGAEIMTAKKDENGNTVYSTADGKRQFVMDNSGRIVSYKIGDKVRQAVQNEHKISTVNAQGISRQTVDGQGNVISRSEVNYHQKDIETIINKDGSINADKFNQITAAATNSEDTAAALITTVASSRNLNIASNYTSRRTIINQDGSVTIKQQNLNGSTQEIRATLQEVKGKNMMILESLTTDKDGNKTLHKSNGIQHKTDTYHKNSDGSYSRQTHYGFSERTQQQNIHAGVLSADGRWGNSVDRDLAMTGFNQKDFNEHLSQVSSGVDLRAKVTAEDVASITIDGAAIAILGQSVSENFNTANSISQEQNERMNQTEQNRQRQDAYYQGRQAEHRQQQKKDWREEALELDSKKHRLKEDVENVKRDISRHNNEFEYLKKELERTDLSQQQRDELRNHKKDMNDYAEKRNAYKHELEETVKKHNSEIEAHNSHVNNGEDVK